MLRSLYCANKLCARTHILWSLYKNSKQVLKQEIRRGHIIPKNQYNQFDKWPPVFKPSVVITNYELIPIIFLMVYDLVLVVGFVIYFMLNKESIMWKPSQTERTEISRTMDLRHPTIHKLMVITRNSYDPWPEMQDVLDAMKRAEMQSAQRNALC